MRKRPGSRVGPCLDLPAHRRRRKASAGPLVWTGLVLAVGVLPGMAAGEDILYPAEGVDPGFAEVVKAGALHQVNHLSSRRRLTTFFVNEQTPFYGVQLNYVNVGRGNLTFLNRDLVRLARIPIVIGRVYDSRLGGEGDFGKGWKLSVAEVIHVDGRQLRYIDASGSEHLLWIEGRAIVSPYPHHTGIQGGRRLGSMVELDTGTLIKRFRPIGEALYLDEVRSREGDHLRFDYEGTRVARVSSNLGRFVALRRDFAGRITEVEDDAGRSVRYDYDGAGQLSGVTDVGGRAWQLRYDAEGLLSRLVDPRGSAALEAAHGQDGRVRQIRVLYDAMSFEYDGSATTARNAHQQAATFWQDSSGLTTVAQDFAGSVTEVGLSDALRPVTLTFDAGLMGRLDYNPDATLREVTRFMGAALSTTRLEYDGDGRLTAAYTDDERVAQYGYDVRGRPVHAEDASGHRSYQYAGRSVRRLTVGDSELDLQTNPLGLLTGFSNQRQAVRLTYDERDQLRHLSFRTEDQESEARFDYGAAGLRTAGTYTREDTETAA